MRVISTISIMAIAVSSGLLPACSSSPKASFYTLNPDASLTSEGPPLSVPVVVGPVTVPELVDRPQFVTRLASSEVKLDEYGRWGAPLKSDIARVLAADLGKLLGSDLVSAQDAGWDMAKAWRVRVDVVGFDSVPGDAVIVDALWSVRAPGKQDPIMGRSVKREPVSGNAYDALVAAHDRALAAVSRDIASAIRHNAAQ